MKHDKDKLSNMDLEGINKVISQQNRRVNGKHPKGRVPQTDLHPEKGRVVQDARGRRVVFNVVNGRPQITGYEGD